MQQCKPQMLMLNMDAEVQVGVPSEPARVLVALEVGRLEEEVQQHEAAGLVASLTQQVERPAEVWAAHLCTHHLAAEVEAMVVGVVELLLLAELVAAEPIVGEDQAVVVDSRLAAAVGAQWCLVDEMPAWMVLRQAGCS